jgi:hypothetical protein
MSQSSYASRLEALALISGGDQLEPEEMTQTSDEQQEKYSDLLWSLWRFGVTKMIAQPSQVIKLKASRNRLSPPPSRPKHSVELLSDLSSRHAQALSGSTLSSQRDLWRSAPPWPHRIEVLSIPEEPFILDGLHLCFHDELIGVDNALLVHYGPSQYELNGYHPVISALSVPLDVDLSALIILRMKRREAQRWVDFPITRDRETCVIHISARGELVQGPWWPKLNVPSRQGERERSLE